MHTFSHITPDRLFCSCYLSVCFRYCRLDVMVILYWSPDHHNEHFLWRHQCEVFQILLLALISCSKLMQHRMCKSGAYDIEHLSCQ
jgi:hypothetical protein